jgi:hypothetical protein
MNTESRTILKLLLPEFLVDDFQIVKVEEISSIIDIYLGENNEFTDDNYISHGFHKQVKVKYFPLRGKQVALFAKRRRWIHKETKQVTSKDWNLIAKGTHMTADFASFLKGIN